MCYTNFFFIILIILILKLLKYSIGVFIIIYYDYIFFIELHLKLFI